jgi:hypothetical protein
MDDLFGPIVGVTLVLISVFLPAAFLPGITGQMYRQFALVIAVTAILSGINAATLKPTQCALWLRAPDPSKRKNFFLRGFNAVYDRLEKTYAGLIGRLVRHSRVVFCIGLLLGAASIWGLTRAPTGFIPTEDQGYVMAIVQLPDAASLAEGLGQAGGRVGRVAAEQVGLGHAVMGGHRLGDALHAVGRDDAAGIRRVRPDPAGYERAREPASADQSKSAFSHARSVPAPMIDP